MLTTKSLNDEKPERERVDITMLRVGEYGCACCLKDQIHWFCFISKGSGGPWRRVIPLPNRVPASAILDMRPSRFGITLVTKAGYVLVYDLNAGGGAWHAAGPLVEATK